MKKILALLLVLCMLLTLAACSTDSGDKDTGAGNNDAAANTDTPDDDTQDDQGGGSSAGLDADDPTFNLIMGHGAAEGSIGDLYCLEFKRLIEEATDGLVTVDVYSGSSLGTYGEMLQSLRTGDISGMIFQPAPAVSFVPELALLDLPYAFLGNTQSEIDEVLNNSVFTEALRDACEQAGYKFISIAQAASFREVTSNREIRSMSDLNGLNIRVLENKYHMAFWQSVGANPTPVAFGELYLSLQQGLVDAQENPYDTSYAAGFAEVQNYVVNTHHILYPNLFIVNDALYNSMPDAYQDIFDSCAAQAKVYAEQLMAESAQVELQGLLDGDMELIEFDDDELAKMAEAGKVVEDMLRDDLGDDIVDTFLSALGK